MGGRQAGGGGGGGGGAPSHSTRATATALSTCRSPALPVCLSSPLATLARQAGARGCTLRAAWVAATSPQAATSPRYTATSSAASASKCAGSQDWKLRKLWRRGLTSGRGPGVQSQEGAGCLVVMVRPHLGWRPPAAAGPAGSSSPPAGTATAGSAPPLGGRVRGLPPHLHSSPHAPSTSLLSSPHCTAKGSPSVGGWFSVGLTSVGDNMVTPRGKGQNCK